MALHAHRIVWISLVQVAMVVPAMGTEATPSTLPADPALMLALDEAGVVIVSPEAAAYRAIADRLAESLGKLTGRRPRVAADTILPADLGPGVVIALGNMMDSRLVRGMYLQAYDFTDYAWPSPGGHVLRTIRDPLGTGAHVLLVGGSDPAGIAEAADELIAIIQAGPAKLHYLNRVKLGCWAKEIDSYTSEFLSGNDAIWLRSGMSGSWEYMRQIAQAGLGYLRTGDERYLPVFKREMQWWLDHDVHNPRGDAPQMLHGFVNQLILMWDLIRDHPFFTADERQRYDNDFLYVFRSSEGPGRIEKASGQNLVRDNHGTRTGLDAFFGGRFFLRRFNLPEAKRWLEIADGYFGPQMASTKPVCDDWDQQWASSLFNTLVYAMGAGRQEYLRSEALRLAADRALIAHPIGGAPFGYMSACAVATGDTGYLSGFEAGEPFWRQCAAMAGQGKGRGDDILRSFCAGHTVRPRSDLLGVAVAPVDRMWFDTIDATDFNPAGIFKTTVPREACFDKVSLREGWNEQDFYILFDGISGGHHAYQNANCIVEFREAGLSWLGTGRRFYTSADPRFHNGATVAFDGSGPGSLHRYARLLYADSEGDYLAVAGALQGLGDTDWERHILRRRGKWTLIVDRFRAARTGELLAERSWHVYGTANPQPDGLISRQDRDGRPFFLHLQSAGLLPENRCYAEDEPGPGPSPSKPPALSTWLREAVRVAVDAGQSVELATLLHVTGPAEEAAFHLAQTSDGWRVQSADQTVDVSLAGGGSRVMTITSGQETLRLGCAASESAPSPPGDSQPASGPAVALLPAEPPAPPAALHWQSMAVGRERITAVAIGKEGQTAAGDASGCLALFRPDGSRSAEAKMESPILSLHFVDRDVIVGEDRGALTRLGPDGSPRWQIVIPYVPMAWPYWTEYASRIREITSADINGDGSEEILLSNSDRRVYAFDCRGSEIWRGSVEWGVYTAMTAAGVGNTFRLYGGTSRPSIHGWCIAFGPDGKVRKHYSRLDIQSWSIPSQFCDMRLADVDGDGRIELVTGIDTNCRQLIVYRPDGVIAWDADVGGAAQAIAIRPADTPAGAAVVYCASRTGYVAAFDGKTGKQLFSCFIGQPAVFVAAHGQDQVVAISSSGKVSIIDRQGLLVGRQKLGIPVTALLRPGDHRATGIVLLGTADGRLLKLAQPGE